MNVDNLLNRYRDLVVKGSKRLNLVSRRDVNNVVDQLISDSLLADKWSLCHLRSPAIDIGTGAGFPGLPLKLVKPDLSLHLVDSNRRKGAFLKLTIRELELDSVEVIIDRIENLVKIPDYQRRYATLLSRGVCDLKSMLEWGNILLVNGGEMLLWKGSRFEDELKCFSLKGWSEPYLWWQASGLVLVRFVKEKN